MTHFVRFTVSGESLTRLARDSVMDGHWRNGLKLLVEDLEGMSYDNALAVLKGEKKIVGQNESLALEAEDPDIAEALADDYRVALLGDALCLKNRLYRPYAHVSSFGAIDLDDALEEYRRGKCGGRRFDSLPLDKGDQEELALHRALFYADNRKADLAFVVKGPTGQEVYALFAADNEMLDLPIWMAPPDNPQTAFDLSSWARVDERGYVQRYSEAARVSYETGTTASSSTPETAAAEAARRAERQAREDAQLQEVEAEIAIARDRVIAFANADEAYGWHDFTFHHGDSGRYVSLRAPKRALIAFALSRTAARHLMPDYTAFSQMGWKMMMDNPLHTDVWLGCGLPLDASAYDRDSLEYQAFMDMTFAIQEELLGFEFHVLASGGQSFVAGRIVTPTSPDITKDTLLLVPHAGVEFDLAARKAGAVICEQGGKLAHLVTVCREGEKPIVRIPGALNLLREGMRVSLNLKEGKLHISSI